MLIIFEEHVLGSEGNGGACCCTKWHLGYRVPLLLVEIAGTCVRKDSGSECASLSASLVSFERRSSSCRVIRAGILASCANTSKRKEALSPFEGSLFKDLSNQTSFCFSLSSGRDGTETWTGAVISDVVAALSHRGSDCTVIITIFQTGCLLAEG